MQQLDQQNYLYDEISLRELIEVLLKGWKLIAVITAVCVFVSGVLSFFVIDPTYEAKTLLMASFATDKLSSLQSDSQDIEGILDSISTYPIMTIQTYKEQLNNPKILQQTIDELKLDEMGIKRADLRGMIELETIKDTNLIAVKVKHTDPELAAKIANTLAVKFTHFITEMAREQASKSSQFLKAQLEVEKKKLDEALLELKQFLSQPRSVDELNQELTSKLELLTKYKTSLVEKEVELNKTRAALETAQQELNSTPKVLVTKKSLYEDPVLNQVVTDAKGISVEDSLQISMENEEINPLYIKLNSNISDYKLSITQLSSEIENIKSKIETTKKEIEDLQVELAEKEHQKRLIERKVTLSQSTYDAFMNKYEEMRIAESTEIGDSSITIVSQAVVPEVPVAPKKMLNVAIAAVLGIMISVFIVFFKNYWETSAESVSS